MCGLGVLVVSLCFGVAVFECIGVSVSRCFSVLVFRRLGVSASVRFDVLVSQCLGLSVFQCLGVSMSLFSECFSVWKSRRESCGRQGCLHAWFGLS